MIFSLLLHCIVWFPFNQKINPQKVQYSEDKTKRLLVNYMLRQVKSKAVHLTQAGFEDTLAKKIHVDKPWIVLFYETQDDKEESWPLQTKLSAIFVSTLLLHFPVVI